jgi:uncharacterized membrane protein YuzA (DUF378 family)
MLDQKSIAIIVQILLIAGALNWGAVAYNGFDAVKYVTGGGDIEKYVKFAVAIAGAYALYEVYQVYSK